MSLRNLSEIKIAQNVFHNINFNCLISLIHRWTQFYDPYIDIHSSYSWHAPILFNILLYIDFPAPLYRRWRNIPTSSDAGRRSVPGIPDHHVVMIGLGLVTLCILVGLLQMVVIIIGYVLKNTLTRIPRQSINVLCKVTSTVITSMLLNALHLGPINPGDYMTHQIVAPHFLMPA